MSDAPNPTPRRAWPGLLVATLLGVALAAGPSLRSVPQTGGGPVTAAWAQARHPAGPPGLAVPPPDPGVALGAAPVFARGSGLPIADPDHGSLLRRDRLLASEPAAQTECLICLMGSAFFQINQGEGYYRVDQVYNGRAGGPSGTLRLQMRLSAAYPVFGQTLSTLPYADFYQLGSLASGASFNNVNSGTKTFTNNAPAGTYYALMVLYELVGAAYQYTDFIVFPNVVSCTGSACTIVTGSTPTPTVTPTTTPTTPPSGSCVENATTMCLAGGRYRVTCRWKNRYAGGAEATLSKAKLTDATGAFWLFSATAYENMIRISTATPNGRAWIAIPTFTDVEFWIKVVDTVNGQSKEYHSDPGNRTLIYDPTFFVYP